MAQLLLNAWEILINFSESSIIFMLMNSKLTLRKSNKLLILLGIICNAAVTSVLNFFEMHFIWTSLICYISDTLLSIALFRNSIAEKLTWSAVMSIIILFCNAALTTLFSLFPDNLLAAALDFSSSGFRLFSTGLYIVTLFALTLIVSKYHIFKSFSIKYISGVAILCFIAILGANIVIEFQSVLCAAGVSAWLCAVLIFIFLGIICLLLYLFAKLDTTATDITEKETQNLQLKQEQLYAKDISKIVTDVRQIKHDYVNHMTVIKRLVAEENYELLKDYMNDYDQEYGRVEAYAITGNAAVDAMLSSKILTCRSENIKTKISIVTWKELGISSYEYVAILGNLLDNAIKACRDIDEDSRYITIIARESKSMQSITITNSRVSGSNDFNSLKLGMGIPRVIKLVERYGGTCLFSPIDDRFSVDIFLPLKGAQP